MDKLCFKKSFNKNFIPFFISFSYTEQAIFCRRSLYSVLSSFILLFRNGAAPLSGPATNFWSVTRSPSPKILFLSGELFSFLSSFGPAFVIFFLLKGVNMKRVILSMILLGGFSAVTTAQTASRASSTRTRAASTTTKAKKPIKKSTPSDTLNNRRIYLFKNGQRSTPTGAEATPSSVGGQYAAVQNPATGR